MLGGEHDGIDCDRSVVLVAQRDLALGIGAQPGEFAGLAHLGLTLDEPMREGDGGGHQHIGLVGGEAEHQTLVAGALLARVFAIDTLCNVDRLLADDIEHAAGGAIEAHVGGVVADVEHGLAHHGLDIDPHVGRDFAGDDDDTRLDQGLTGHAGAFVLSEDRIEDGIGDLVGDLVRVAFRDGLGGEEKIVRHGSVSLS